VIDARAIQAYYAGLVARASGLEIAVTLAGDVVTIEATPVAVEAEQQDKSPNPPLPERCAAAFDFNAFAAMRREGVE